jgi:hypothetical protein
MHYHRKKTVIGLLVLAVILFVIQAGIWARETVRAHSETDKQNIEMRHAPNEIPFVTAILLLIGAGVVASIPKGDLKQESHV